MKVALCSRRKILPGKRQDGFTPLPTEATYDLVAEVEIPGPHIDLIKLNDRYFFRNGYKYGPLDLFREIMCGSVLSLSKKHLFEPPLTPHGNTCTFCGIHSNSQDADKPCNG